MIKLTIAILLIAASFSAQQAEIEQLTNGDFEIRNPVFPQYEGNWPGGFLYSGDQNSLLFFEVYKREKVDTTSNIGYLRFNYDEARFEEEILFLTNNNSIQQKISATAFPKYMVMWETNKNGNWDIEYTIQQSDSTWSEPKILVGSEDDEINAKFIYTMHTYYYDDDYRNTVWITYEKNNSVYLVEFEDSLMNIETVYQSASAIQFGNPVGFVSDDYKNEGIFIAAEMKESGSSKTKIVLTDKKFDSNEWREYVVISDSGNSHNPDFNQDGWGYPGPYFLTFEIEENGRNSIQMVYNYDDYQDPYSKGLIEIVDDQQISTYDLKSYIYFIVTRSHSNSDYRFIFPFIYKQVRNDSTYLIMNQYGYWDDDIEVPLLLNETTFTIGPVAPYPSAMVSYMVWTDETERGINLFGMKRYDSLGPVEDEAVQNNIYLYQNYPNPFNPSTIIKFNIPQNVKRETSNVKLIVYDILGREVKTLLNKPMQTGEFEVEFDGGNLPSGIYFYRLNTDKYSQTRKMLLIK